MKSIVGRLDNSPEGSQVPKAPSTLSTILTFLSPKGGITHGFVVEFESAEDGDYYVFKDPTHIAFTKLAGEVLENAIVVDFNPGSFLRTKV